MVASIAISFTVFPSKLANFRSNPVQEHKAVNLNIAAIYMESYPNVAKEGSFKKSSVVSPPIPFHQHELQYAVKKITDIMTSKSTEDDQLEELVMIDSIQRLGLEHYFRDEINAALQRHHAIFCALEDGAGDLHETALRFRLLRQEGYNITADVFSKFKDDDGKFKQQCNDIKGLLSLFEASQLRIAGESMMDEAGKFSEQSLKASLMMNVLEQPKARMIEKTLRGPFHRSLTRISASSILEDLKLSLEFLHGSRGLREWVENVQEVARIDFNMSQMTHRKEILQISRWGKELSFTKEMHFARIQPFKWYIWSLGTLPGPNMADERVELAKPVSFIYMIDDIFDVYGTLDELTLFTEAVKRWDHADLEPLPTYMRACFMALRDMVKDISHKTLLRYNWDPQDSLRKAWGDLCDSFLTEAKWFASRDLPSSEEYLKNGVISVGVPVVLMHAFFLLGRGINKTSVDALDGLPSIVSSSATIVRLWNDVGTDKNVNGDEDKDGSYTDCYMKEHNVDSESMRKHVNGVISDAWKRLNEECLSPTSPFSADFKAACLNFARMASVMYSFDENHRLLDLQKHLNFSLKETLNH